MSEEEMNTALDALEAEQTTDSVDDIDNDVINDVVDDNTPPEKPPGYKTYDEWVKEGKDPADYKGENAYKAEYERIKEIRELKSTMNQVVDSVGEWKEQQTAAMARQIEQARQDALRELEAAKEAEDIDAALVARDKIDNLNRQSVQVAEKVNPVISGFVAKTPIIDPSSPQYDKDFHEDMKMIHNSTIDKLVGGDRQKASLLSQDQISRVMNMAYREAKALHADKFTSPRNNRSAAPASVRRPAANPEINLKSIKGNPRNQNDRHPAQDIYDEIKSRDPAAAEIFAKNVMGQ